jgi:hypothetical protein
MHQLYNPPINAIVLNINPMRLNPRIEQWELRMYQILIKKFSTKNILIGILGFYKIFE